MNKDKIMNRLGIVTPRDKVQFIIAGGLMMLGCIVLLIGLFIEPSGQIHSSVLIAFGEVGTLAASVLGIDAVYKTNTTFGAGINYDKSSNGHVYNFAIVAAHKF